MKLDVLRTYELVIFFVGLSKYNVNAIFNYINSLLIGTNEIGTQILKNNNIF